MRKSGLLLLMLLFCVPRPGGRTVPSGQRCGEKPVVCDIRGQRSETTSQSDRIDADWLSEQLGTLRMVHHGTPGVAPLKELVRCYTIWSRTRRGSSSGSKRSTAVARSRPWGRWSTVHRNESNG